MDGEVSRWVARAGKEDFAEGELRLKMMFGCGSATLMGVSIYGDLYL